MKTLISFIDLVLLVLQISATFITGSYRNRNDSITNVGINYGRVGDNLPSPEDVANLVESIGINQIRIYDYDSQVIEAFYNKNISLMVTIPNLEIPNLATNSNATKTWVQENIIPHLHEVNITTIIVGNELDTEPKLVPTMWQLHYALEDLNLEDTIKISTTKSMEVLATSSPPSTGAFENTTLMKTLLEFLSETSSNFMINIYPFFPLEDDHADITLAYALFQENNGIDDPNSGLHYSNLFDCMYDAVVFAMNSLGYSDIPLVVSETGWPSMGDDATTTIANAKNYNNNLIKHLISKVGTPARPNALIQAILFAIFNEDQKPGATTERNFGLFYPNMTLVYPIDNL